MSKNELSFTVNAWSVEWDEDHRRRRTPCEAKVECSGQLTQGVATFMKNGQLVVVGRFVNPPCCKQCAIAYTAREGLKGTITIRQVAEALVRPAN